MRSLALLLPILALPMLLPAGGAQAQTVRQCEANDAACRQNARRSQAGQPSSPRPASRSLRQNSDGTLSPRTGRYRQNGIFGSGQATGGCDTRTARPGQRSGPVPNC